MISWTDRIDSDNSERDMRIRILEERVDILEDELENRQRDLEASTLGMMVLGIISFTLIVLHLIGLP